MRTYFPSIEIIGPYEQNIEEDLHTVLQKGY